MNSYYREQLLFAKYALVTPLTGSQDRHVYANMKLNIVYMFTVIFDIISLVVYLMNRNKIMY
jgi:hypothetical protein